jgi:hypothetical protein
MSLSTQVMQDIAVERDTQDRQWGGASHDDTHVMADWHQYINYQSDLMECRDRLVKIAALAIAAIDSIDRSL